MTHELYKVVFVRKRTRLVCGILPRGQAKRTAENLTWLSTDHKAYFIAVPLSQD